MTKQIKLLCCSLRVQSGNFVRLEYILVYDDNNRRKITIQGPYNNFNAGLDWQGKMKSVFLTIMRKSGYLHNIDKEGNINMTFSEFMNFEFHRFNNLTIHNKLV